jgi:hypothetical protein
MDGIDQGGASPGGSEHDLVGEAVQFACKIADPRWLCGDGVNKSFILRIGRAE